MTTLALCLCLLSPTLTIDRGDLMQAGPSIENAGEWIDPRPATEWKDDEDE